MRLFAADKSGQDGGRRLVHRRLPRAAAVQPGLQIGIDVDPAHRRRGYGAEAQALLARYLFETYTVERVEATTDIENIPEQRALERAGFTREGVLRRAQWRAGDWRDVCLYSKLRGE